MKLTSAGKFWLSYFLFLLCVGYTGLSFGDDATSGSQSGAISGAASKAGAVGFIDQSTKTSTVEAVDMQDRAPGVFGAGVASGSNPCLVSVSGGLSVPGGGFNLGRSYEDKGCTTRENLRLMAAISNSAEPANQMLLRNIACQNVQYWDSFEMVYNETGDERYYCSNPRPVEGRVIMRAVHLPNKATREVAYDLGKDNPVTQMVINDMPEKDIWVNLGY